MITLIRFRYKNFVMNAVIFITFARLFNKRGYNLILRNTFVDFMGLFGKIFGSGEGKAPKEEKQALPWQKLTTLDQLNTIEKASKTKVQAIFKHSTRCGISSMVIRNFESSFDLTEQDLDLYYLDLLSFRNISDEISAKFQIWHESPQFIIIKNGTAVHHSSHSAITPQVLHQFV